jgi:hypothetical protein
MPGSSIALGGSSAQPKTVKHINARVVNNTLLDMTPSFARCRA